MNPFFKFPENISKGHSVHNFCSACTYQPRVSPKVRSSVIFCVVWFLHTLQKSGHAIFDTLLSKYISHFFHQRNSLSNILCSFYSSGYVA